MSARISIMSLVVGLLVAAGVMQASPAAATHNRASQISWTDGAGPGQVEFTLTFVARASYYPSVDDVGETFTDPTFDYGDGTSESPEFTVLDIDETTDSLYARASGLVHIYSGSGPFTAELGSCCRLSSPTHINNPDGDYDVSSVVSPGKTGSPAVSAAPVVMCPLEGDCYFRINATDPAGRTLRWRLASASEGGGGFVQPGPPYAPSAATVDPDTGQYSWDTRGAQVNAAGDTYYSSQVVVEALDSSADVVASQAVDFFIRLRDDQTIVCADTDGNGNPDNDSDALCDNWEDTGIPIPNSSDVLPLYDGDGDGTISSSERTDKNVPDVFVEIDWMQGRRPRTDALRDVVNAFATPQAGSGRSPVRLHLSLAATGIPYSDYVTMDGCGDTCPAGVADFDELKEQNFGTPSEQADDDLIDAKSEAFHYAIIGQHYRDLTDASSSPTGLAEITGNDLVLTMGSSFNTRDGQAGTFMHELGHNLGLLHGGGDVIGCKPNYVSVMNYTRQIESLFNLHRRLDYSSQKLTTLDESSLSESDGVLGVTSGSIKVAFSRRNALSQFESETAMSPGAIDWNHSAFWPWESGIQSGRVQSDINHFGVCGEGAGTSPDYQTLVGYDDWANLTYDFRAGNDYAEGVHTSVEPADEMPVSVLDAVAARDTDSDGVDDLYDNCVTKANPGQEDRDGDEFGDVCSTLDLPPGPSTASAPVVRGGSAVGSTLIVTGAVPTGVGASARYQWQRDTVAVAGAASSRYRLQPADAGHRMRVLVIGSQPGVATRRAVSNSVAVAAQAVKRPRIKGQPQVGSRLRARLGRWVAPGYTFKVTWFVGHTATAHHGKRMRVRRSIAGKRITIRVTATRAGFPSVVTTSRPFKVRRG